MRLFFVFLFAFASAQHAQAIPESATTAPQSDSQAPETEKSASQLKPTKTDSEAAQPAMTRPVVSRGERGSRWRDDTVVCKQVTKIGSRFKEQRCHSVADWEFLTKETREGLGNGLLR